MIRKLSEAFERLRLRVTGRLAKAATKVVKPPPKRQKRAKRRR